MCRTNAIWRIYSLAEIKKPNPKPNKRKTKKPNPNQHHPPCPKQTRKPNQHKTPLDIFIQLHMKSFFGDFPSSSFPFPSHFPHQEGDMTVQDWRKMIPLPSWLLRISWDLLVNTTSQYNCFPESQATCSPKENVRAYLVGRRKVSLRSQVDVLWVSPK